MNKIILALVGLGITYTALEMHQTLIGEIIELFREQILLNGNADASSGSQRYPLIEGVLDNFAMLNSDQEEEYSINSAINQVSAINVAQLSLAVAFGITYFSYNFRHRLVNNVRRLINSQRRLFGRRRIRRTRYTRRNSIPLTADEETDSFEMIHETLNLGNAEEDENNANITITDEKGDGIPFPEEPILAASNIAVRGSRRRLKRRKKYFSLRMQAKLEMESKNRIKFLRNRREWSEEL